MAKPSVDYAHLIREANIPAPSGFHSGLLSLLGTWRPGEFPAIVSIIGLQLGKTPCQIGTTPPCISKDLVAKSKIVGRTKVTGMHKFGEE